ncbi:Long chain acyl-CoA synthetase 7 peroxisomal, partial [Balamuthia mandrillaris]
MSFLRASQEKVKPLRASSDGSHANSNTATAPQQEGEGATVGSLFLIPDTKYAIAWICDECHHEIEPDKRYKSFEVPDFDLCESCYQKGKHPFPMFLETPEMGNAEPVQGSTSAHTLTNLWKRYLHRPCFGTRERLQDGSYGDFQWVTYDEVFTRSCTFASGLHSIFQPGDFIGICARNRLEWYIADYACLLYHFIPIPIHTTIDSNSIKHIINNAQIKGVICSKELLPKFIQASSSNCPSLLYLIQMEDGIEEGAQTLLQSSSSTLKLVSMKELFDAGEKNPVPMPPFDSVKPDDIVTLCYTSGSTGVPKGAIITDFILNSDINVQYTYPDPYVVLSFSPLAHTERTNVMQSLVLGGRVGIFGEEMDTLFDSFRKLRPTLVSAVPRLYNKLYSDFKEAVAKRHALDPKKPLAQVEEETLRRFEGAFGGRTAMLVTGGAPSSEAVKAWLARCFCCTVYDGYGATECGSICTETYVHENVQVKLVDVPEMQYFSTDLPYPRGEIYVKSDMVIPGYYNNPEETEKAIKDGWFCTGDIGTLIDGKLHIIDRKKNFFKLAQGEYVAPERLETIFLESPFLDQLCIWGDSLKDCLIAICVINKTVAKEWLLQNKQIEKQKEREEEEDDESWDALCQNVQLKRAVMKDFGRIAAHHKDDLAAYEVPRGVILDACGWNADNGLMTPTNKVCRRAIAQHYKKEIESAYLELEVDRSTTKAKVFQVLKQVLPGLNGGEEVAEEGDFSSLGGDSLSAVQVVQQLNEAFQVDMPLDVFFQRQQNDSGASIDDLSRWIDQQLSFASVSSSSSSTYYSSSASYRL